MTTLSDNFNRANSGSLGTASGGFSWTEVVGSIGIDTNRANPTTGTDLARAESDLASADHYTQATILTGATISNHGLCVRFDASVQTFYMGNINSDAATVQIYKCVTGSFTSLGSQGGLSFAANDVVKLEANGSAVNFYQNGTQRISITDSSITGNTRTGLRFGSANQFFDDFSAADLAAAGGPVPMFTPPALDGIGSYGSFRGNRPS